MSFEQKCAKVQVGDVSALSHQCLCWCCSNAAEDAPAPAPARSQQSCAVAVQSPALVPQSGEHRQLSMHTQWEVSTGPGKS